MTVKTTSDDGVPITTSAPRGRTVWTSLTGIAGFVMGLVPHVLHHVAPIVGAAALTGAAGTALSASVGLVASAPMLVRLHRRFRSWWAPAIALAAFTAAFGVSTAVLGPAISGGSGAIGPIAPTADPTIVPAEHDSHHAPPITPPR